MEVEGDGRVPWACVASPLSCGLRDKIHLAHQPRAGKVLWLALFFIVTLELSESWPVRGAIGHCALPVALCLLSHWLGLENPAKTQ